MYFIGGIEDMTTMALSVISALARCRSSMDSLNPLALHTVNELRKISTVMAISNGKSSRGR
ncbi:hypothetical protein C942_00901 [Photobacterium marinum]|uniref:Uncharacterized protein n=1 Tax=Photobacterium marinum TaxID=1056511 RepID=L8JE81_9GAMM|nr:hypothetical protein C942_00901 [Photobacterium marinum]